MASPQIEDGHVDLANEIVEALAKIRISGEEMQCLWVIFRKTYGWHKKKDNIALSQFCQLTNLAKPNICRALSKLLSKKIIGIIKNDNGITTYEFNKDFDVWQPLSKKITLSKVIKGGIKKDNKSLSILRHTKETSTKETSTKETYSEDFLNFWDKYPHKKGKEEAFKAWQKIKPDTSILFDAIKAQKQEKVELQQARKFCPEWPNASTWLNQKRWEDEIKEIQGKNSW